MFLHRFQACALPFHSIANLLLLSFIMIILFFNHPTTSLSFNFPRFDPTNQDINYKWNASASNGIIYLTTNQQEMMNFSFGRATYAQPLLLWDKASGNLTDFSTNFTFNINSLGTCYGDGITFFLAANDIPYQVGGIGGGGLGLAVLNQTSTYPFVAVEFDTYPNIWDPNYEHVGIDINSVASAQTMRWNTSIFMNDGTENFARINYNSSAKTLSVAVNGFDATSNKSVLQMLYYVVDLRKYLPQNVTVGFSASTGSCFEINSINSWNFSSSLSVSNVNVGGNSSTEVGGNSSANLTAVAGGLIGYSKGKPIGLVVGLSIGACVLVAILCFVCIICSRRMAKGVKEDEAALEISMVDEFEKGMGPRRFLFNDLACATSNFAEQVKLGEGGFGAVYKGFLKNENSYVAVKKISKGSKQGIKEYASEIIVISKLRHRNLVQLFGWCHEKMELLLVYEYMPNGSLDSHLYKDKSKFLTWELRYKIARDLAAALLYLHEECEQCVIHRDIKSSNVILDSNFNAKLGDFGLARLVDHDKSSQTTDLAGTMGYLAPECVVTGKFNKESDVYSFGVVALEIACGQRPMKLEVCDERVHLVNWVWELYGSQRLHEAIDPRMGGEFDEHQVVCLMVVGLWCAHPYQKLRPSIRQAIRVLNFEAPLPVLPLNMPVPTYMTPESLGPKESSSFTASCSESFSDGR